MQSGMSQNAKPRGQARAALLNEMHPSLIQIGAIYLRFADFQKLTLASSNRSALVESTTKMMPSVQRVYDLQSGLNLSWPPTSHMRNAVTGASNLQNPFCTNFRSSTFVVSLLMASIALLTPICLTADRRRS